AAKVRCSAFQVSVSFVITGPDRPAELPRNCPSAGTKSPLDSCEAAHLGYVVSGRIHVASNDGSEVDLGPGDAYRLDPGHDAWVVGDEPVISLEFESKTAETYAKT